MTANHSAKRKPIKPPANSPRITVVLNADLYRWVQGKATSLGLADAAFIRMKLTELQQGAA